MFKITDRKVPIFAACPDFIAVVNDLNEEYCRVLITENTDEDLAKHIASHVADTLNEAGSRALLGDMMAEPIPEAKCDTQAKAARKTNLNIKGLRKDVLNALVKHPMTGWTGEELSRALMKNLYSIKPRFTELRDMGLAKDSGARRENKHGNEEIVWTCTEAGTAMIMEGDGS